MTASSENSSSRWAWPRGGVAPVESALSVGQVFRKKIKRAKRAKAAEEQRVEGEGEREGEGEGEGEEEDSEESDSDYLR